MTIDIDILDSGCANTNTGCVIGQIMRIITITKLDNANRHALPFKALLVQLVDLVSGGKFVTRQILLRPIISAVTTQSTRLTTCQQSQWRHELRKREVIQTSHRLNKRTGRNGHRWGYR